MKENIINSFLPLGPEMSKSMYSCTKMIESSNFLPLAVESFEAEAPPSLLTLERIDFS